MIKSMSWIAIAVIVVVAGFLYRYESLDPCEWMTQELTNYGTAGISGLGATAGVVMGTGECLQNWMDLRVQDAEK